jgi:Flp pilus assembly protein TadG
VSNRKPSPSGRRSNRRRGQAMVEFALIIPIFMLILSGILDGGFALYSRMTVINAAREGARAAVMVDPKTAASTIPTVAWQRAVSSAKQAGLTINQASVTTTCLQTTSATTPPPACTWTAYDSTTNPSGAQSGDSVSVTVTYTYHASFPLAFGAQFDLTSKVQMVIE